MNARKRFEIHVGTVLHSHGEFDVIDCETCGFKHIIPLPSEEELCVIYKHEYHVKDKPLMLTHQLEDKDWLETVNNTRLEKLEDYLGGVGSILDVGCGNGFFLTQAQQRGWDVTGIEPSMQAAAYAQSQGLHVLCTTFDDQSASTLDHYDVIHLGDVLEHVPDPVAVLQRSFAQLNPNGLIAIGVPNEYTPIQKILHEDLDTRPWWVAPPHHINYFDEKTLSSLLTRCGFSPFHSEVSFPMELFLLMGQNYLDDPECGRACHAMRKTLELNLTRSGNRDVLDHLYHCFAQVGMGRTLFIIARKTIS